MDIEASGRIGSVPGTQARGCRRLRIQQGCREAVQARIPAHAASRRRASSSACALPASRHEYRVLRHLVVPFDQRRQCAELGEQRRVQGPDGLGDGTAVAVDQQLRACRVAIAGVSGKVDLGGRR